MSSRHAFVPAVPAPRRSVPALPLLFLAFLVTALGCSVGEGEGYVRSEDLFVDKCWEGPFDLRPTFFAANPFDDTLSIRVQRGEQEIQVSDGFSMLINGVTKIRESQLNTRLPLGLPVGVSPLGFALPPTPNLPAASLSLYFNSSCRSQNTELMAVGGEVEFKKLFSGDPNEDNAEDRLTEGTFQAIVADPRTAIPRPEGAEGPAYTFSEDDTSVVDGAFRFVFHRGTPAQPFP